MYVYMSGGILRREATGGIKLRRRSRLDGAKASRDGDLDVNIVVHNNNTDSDTTPRHTTDKPAHSFAYTVLQEHPSSASATCAHHLSS